MATHSSVLAWRIPGTGKPGGLPSMGSHRVGHDWSDLAAAAAFNVQINLGQFQLVTILSLLIHEHGLSLHHSKGLIWFCSIMFWFFQECLTLLSLDLKCHFLVICECYREVQLVWAYWPYRQQTCKIY